ncbi:hypothetical protein QNI16_05575 [Cytophagaceae bacterium YF14B1]|uniref:Uncharacterized protein n=1 Tax=Xanthocytophaga flava TaxID=3048013 RepID=A0AAE3QIG9_9BACT|nr:hypothetical protein [Xanthocytophaga flavus]MDJ1479947.1 hypothetical protein [Xanthocytophaga flavus]
MELRKSKLTYILIFVLLFFSCQEDTDAVKSNNRCSDVSVRLMYSIVESQLNLLKKTAENLKGVDSATIRDLNYYISDFTNINNQFIIAAGGFVPGYTINLVDPCRKDDKIVSLARTNSNKLKYKNFVAVLLKAKLLEEGQDKNLYFIIDSHFCKENCVFSDSSMVNQTVSEIMLENMILQATILDLALNF